MNHYSQRAWLAVVWWSDCLMRYVLLGEFNRRGQVPSIRDTTSQLHYSICSCTTKYAQLLHALSALMAARLPRPLMTARHGCVWGAGGRSGRRIATLMSRAYGSTVRLWDPASGRCRLLRTCCQVVALVAQVAVYLN